MGGAISSVFVSKKRVEKEIQKFEEDPEGYLKVMEDEFPELTHSLIDNRNRYMAANILKLHSMYPDVIAVVGDGHIPGISELVRELNPEVIRLKRLRAAAQRLGDGGSIESLLAERPGDSNAGAGFSFDFDG
jgi:pheromone shutdown protein TraB